MVLDQELADQVEEDGLSPEVVRVLLKLYSGVLEADAIPGELLRFRLLFPVSTELGAAPDKTAQPLLSKDISGEGKRVLLVDDEGGRDAVPSGVPSVTGIQSGSVYREQAGTRVLSAKSQAFRHAYYRPDHAWYGWVTIDRLDS
jgi:hypothetical protein